MLSLTVWICWQILATIVCDFWKAFIYIGQDLILPITSKRLTFWSGLCVDLLGHCLSFSIGNLWSSFENRRSWQFFCRKSKTYHWNISFPVQWYKTNSPLIGNLSSTLFFYFLPSVKWNVCSRYQANKKKSVSWHFRVGHLHVESCLLFQSVHLSNCYNTLHHGPVVSSRTWTVYGWRSECNLCFCHHLGTKVC